MKKLNKALVLAAALTSGIVAMSVGNTANAQPWGPGVVVQKQCWNTPWGVQCQLVRTVNNNWCNWQGCFYGPDYYPPVQVYIGPGYGPPAPYYRPPVYPRPWHGRGW